MKRFICIVTFLCAVLAVQQISAQPKMRKTENKTKDVGPTLSVRAKSQYTGQTTMPEEVVWKREIYRTLDLKQAENAALYYPTEPIGTRMNLFALVFKLMAEDKIPAYEYRLDGTEMMTPEARVKFKDVLDRFHIFYEEKVERRDTMLMIDNSDIPSSEVLSYFVKENWYFDQRSSTYNSKVVAICPVLHRTDDFSTQATKYPMFWLDYKDISPYLSRMPIMTSDLNNTANINMDDYFTARKFKGDIYKTTNMLNKSLAQYCPTDSAMLKEQKKIEGQLEAFEKNLWMASQPKKEAAQDSTTIAKKDAKESKTITRNSRRREQSSSSSSSRSSKEKKASSKSSSSSKSSAPRVSVRRERR
ncbi:MAG: gliding motility protein GldN [Bacteroides sp.]